MALNSDSNVLRETNNPPLSNNNAPINGAQYDQNIINIYNDLVALNSGGDVPAYDPLKEYDDTTNKFVSYSGFVWLYIFATPTTGTTPIEGTHWTQVPPSVLAHPKNQDLHLDLGGDNEVSAAELSILEITYSDLTTKKAASELVKNKTYTITDYGISIKAISEALLSTVGSRQMRIVKNTYYQASGIIKGVWHGGLSVSIGNIVVWGGKVWINQTGVVGSKLNDSELDGTNWTAEDKTNDTYYFDKDFFIVYDFDNNKISRQIDDRSNVFGDIDNDLNSVANRINNSDWGDESIFDNICGGVYNNNTDDGIIGNICGAIGGNVISASGIFNNRNNGSIQNNVVTKIADNKNNGEISGNENGGSISQNSNNGTINSNFNAGSIIQNSNNGEIEGIGAANSSIQYNINNGTIINTTTGIIQDAQVNK